MTKIKEDFKCPKCKKKNRVKLFDEVSNDSILSILNRELFTFECTSCNEKIIIDYPIKIKGTNYVIYYTPGCSSSIDCHDMEYMRVCDTFEDFKEKIMIFEDNLNDIVIEFIKEFLFKQLDNEMQKEVTDIRYDGKNEENLIFYLCGVKKSIGCSLIFYKEILNRSKIKNIKNCINIDSNTYSSYFKMR